MPRTQIPLIGDQGLYIPQDPLGSTGIAPYPFYLNGYFEKGTVGLEGDRKISFVKRPGLYNSSISFGTIPPYSAQGMLSSIDRTNVYIYANDGSANNQTYVWSAGGMTAKGIAPAAAGHWTYTGPVAFTALDGISYGANHYAVVTDFNKGAVVAIDGTWTEITDAIFTGLTKATNFAALDGYVFIGTTNNRIYNCDLNTPTTWQATSFLVAADTPGQIIWLSRIRNFIVAFKQRSMEFYEDIGNPTPGSPLEPRKQYNRTIGCINPNTIQEMSDGIIFAGASVNSAPRMYKLRKDDLQVVEISNRYIQQCLSTSVFSTSYQPDTNSSATPLFNGQSQAFGWSGKELYLINLKDPNNVNTSRVTQVYDNDLGVWTAWATSFSVAGSTDPGGFAGTLGQMVIGNSGTVGVLFAVNRFSGIQSTSSWTFFMDLASISITWNDVNPGGLGSNSFPFSWTSDIIDFGSRKRKFMDGLEVIYESQIILSPNLTNTSNPVDIYYMDYNHNTTPNYFVHKTGYVDPGGGARCVVKQMGSFFRRAFSIVNTSNCALKIWAIEIDYNEGESDQDGG